MADDQDHTGKATENKRQKQGCARNFEEEKWVRMRRQLILQGRKPLGTVRMQPGLKGETVTWWWPGGMMFTLGKEVCAGEEIK